MIGAGPAELEGTAVSAAPTRGAGLLTRLGGRLRRYLNVRPGMAGLIFGMLYGLVVLLRYRQYTVVVYDDGLYMQALDGYAHLRAPIIDLRQPGLNVLGEHFSPIYVVLAPIFRVWPSALVLHLSMAVLLGLSVAVIAFVARKFVGGPAALVIAVLYGLSFGVQSIVGVGFYEVAFAAPILAMMGLRWLEGNHSALVRWSLLLLVVKEDLGLTVAAVGVVLLAGREWRRGSFLVVVGAAWSLVAMTVVIPAFNTAGENRFIGQVAGSGGLVSTLAEGTGVKLATLIMTFAITGFLALRSPWVLLTIPTFAWRFVAERPIYWGISWHYSLVLMPIVFIAMIDVIRRDSQSSAAGETRWSSWPALTVAVLATIALTRFGALIELTYPASWKSNDRADAAVRTVNRIPDGASVVTDASLVNRLVPRHQAFLLVTAKGTKPDYAVLDMRNYLRNGMPGAPAADQLVDLRSPSEGITYLEKFVGGTWTLISDDEDYVVLRRS